MLILTRGIGDKVTIFTPCGEKIELVFMENAVGKNSARFGVRASKDVKIVRNELFQKLPDYDDLP